MPVLNLVLSERQNVLLTDLIESGKFHDANEVFEEGLRLVDAERHLENLREQRLRLAVEEGLLDLDQSRFTPVSEGELSLHMQRLGVRAAQQIGSSGE